MLQKAVILLTNNITPGSIEAMGCSIHVSAGHLSLESGRLGPLG